MVGGQHGRLIIGRTINVTGMIGVSAANQCERGKPPSYAASFYGRVLGRGGPHAAEVVWIMSRVIAVTACGFMLAACSATMPSLSLDFMKSAPQAETLAIESAQGRRQKPPGPARQRVLRHAY